MTRFEVTAIGTSSILWNGSWLTLAFLLTPGDRAPSRAPIEPFTGAKSMGVFLTESVVVATILARWPSIPRPSVDVAVPLRLVGEDVVPGTARIRYRVRDAASASFHYGTDTIADNVGVQAVVESQALAGEIAGEDITEELGDLRNPTRNPQLFRVFAQSSGVSQAFDELEAWLQRIGRHVLGPALRPLASPWRLDRNFEASLSAPLSSLICQGDLL
ncbi:MAG: hypothetical protein AAGE52_32515 [Myxococcota bacterium]